MIPIASVRRLNLHGKVFFACMFDHLSAALAAFWALSWNKLCLCLPRLALVNVFESNEISEVTRRMFVKQTKTNISGGPSTGEIYGRLSVSDS